MKKGWVIGLIIVGVLVLLAGFGIFKISGNAITTSDQGPTSDLKVSWVSCYDSDALNFSDPGNVTASRKRPSFWWFLKDKITEYVFEDRCINNYTLYEFYCLNISDSQSIPRLNRTLCEQGCDSGSCLPNLNLEDSLNSSIGIGISSNNPVNYTSNYTSNSSNSIKFN